MTHLTNNGHHISQHVSLGHFIQTGLEREIQQLEESSYHFTHQ